MRIIALIHHPYLGKAVVFASAEDNLFEAAEYSCWGQLKSNGDWDANKVARKIRDLQSTFYEKAYQSRQSLLKHDDRRQGLLNKLS